MATDDKNNDPEQDDFFGDDDDDFGLPELEYEALDDDDSDSSSDEVEMSDDDEASTEEEIDFDSTESSEEESSDDMDIPDDFDNEEESSDDMDIPDDFDDEEEIPDMISDEELEAAMDEEISDEDLNEFYEEESFDDFESSDSGDMGEETDSIFDSDGIDSDEFKDFEQGLDTPAPEKPKYVDTSAYSGASSKEAKGKFTRVVIIGIVLFVTVGAAILYAYNNFFAEDEKPVAAKVVKKPVAKKPDPKPVEKKEEPKQDPKPAPKKAKSNPSTPGTVNSLAERTGNTHVVIASFLDEDMAADYANELAAAGKSPSLIPPFGNAKTTRVAISSYPSLADAQGNVESFKAEYGPNVWLLRY